MHARPIVWLAAALLVAVGARAADDPATVRYRLLNEALARAERPGADWDAAQRDCAGFVRLVYRRATGSRRPLWRRANGSAADYLAAGELLAYNFTRVAAAPSKDAVLTRRSRPPTPGT